MKRILSTITALSVSLLSTDCLATINTNNLTLKKINSHEINQYEATSSKTLLNASTLVLYGRDGLNIFEVTDDNFILKSEYPHLHFASDIRNTVEYTLSENGKSLLSVDFSGNIIVWQITEEYKLVEKQVTEFNPNSWSTSGQLTSSAFYAYENSEREVTKFTPYYWDPANFSITKGSSVTINDEDFDHGKQHHYPDLGLVLHISKDTLMVFDLNNNYQEIFNGAFDFRYPGKIASVYDPVNNTLLIHNYDTVIELKLTADNQVANHREVSRATFLPNDLLVHHIVSTDNRLFAYNYAQLLELTLTADNNYSATEVCAGCVPGSPNLDKETLRLYSKSTSLKVNTINNDGSFSSIERQKEQGRLKTSLSDFYPNLVIGESSSLNFNGRFFTLSALSPERGQTFTKDIPLTDQLHNHTSSYNGFYKLGKQVLYVKNDSYTLISTNADETNLNFKKGKLVLENSSILEEWQAVFALTDTQVVFVSAGDYYLFEASEEGLTFKQVFDLNLESSTRLYKHTSYIVDGVNIYAFDRDLQKLHHLLFDNAQLSLHKSIDLPIFTNGLTDYYGEITYVNERFYLPAHWGLGNLSEHGIYRLEESGFVKEDIALPRVPKMKPARLSNTQSLWFFDVGNYDTLDAYLLDTETENIFSRVGEFNLYEGKYAQKNHYLHFYSKGTMVITNELSPTSESVELTLNQGNPASWDLTSYFSEQQRQDLKFVTTQTVPGVSLSEQGKLEFDGQPSNSQSLIVSVTNSLEQSAELSVQLTYNSAPTAINNLEFAAKTDEELTITFADNFVDDKGLPIVFELNGVLNNMTLSNNTLTITFSEAGEFKLPITTYDIEGAYSKHTLIFKVEEKDESSGDSDSGDSDSGDSSSDDSGSDDSGSGGSSSGDSGSGNSNSGSDNNNSSSSQNTLQKSESKNEGSGGSLFYLLVLMIGLVAFRNKQS